jgi:cytoskeletal protein CcmA (bactofilin family)
MKQQQQVGTIVGSSVHLTGAIKDTSDITIFGSVEGEVTSDSKVIIEENSYIKGPVNAAEVIISGVVIGTINAKQRIEMNPTASVKGNVDTGELLIHSGATFIGKSNMPDKKESATADQKQDDFNVEVEKEDKEEEEAEDEEEE